MNIAAYCDGRIHLQEVRFSTEDIGSSPEDPESLLLGQATFAIEVLLEKGDIGLRVGLVIEELLITGLVGRRRLNICKAASVLSAKALSPGLLEDTRLSKTGCEGSLEEVAG
jgi:hypothetical protein